jgi:hypothetical protein
MQGLTVLISNNKFKHYFFKTPAVCGAAGATAAKTAKQR